MSKKLNRDWVDNLFIIATGFFVFCIIALLTGMICLAIK